MTSYRVWDEPIDPTRDHHRFLELAQLVAEHHATKFGVIQGETLDDYVGDAAEMLAKCARNWDPKMTGKHGNSYLWVRMTGAIIDAHRTRYSRVKANGVATAKKSARLVPLEWQSDGEGGWEPIQMVLVDQAAAQEFEMVDSRLVVGSLLDLLPARHRVVVEEVNLKGRSLREVGDAMGFSPSRICQIQMQAWAWMAAHLNSEEAA